MKKTIYPSIIFSYFDLIIAHYISLVLVWGVFITDIEEAFSIDLYNNIDSWWRISTYFLVFLLSILMTFHLSGRPLSFFENGVAWFRAKNYLQRRGMALSYLMIALIFNPMTYLVYKPHWLILLPDVFLMCIFTKEVLHSYKLRNDLKKYEVEEHLIKNNLTAWITDYNFTAINNYYREELRKSLSFEELLRLIINLKSFAYLKKNFTEIKDAFYPIGWQRDAEPSGFDFHCNEVFNRVLNDERR